MGQNATKPGFVFEGKIGAGLGLKGEVKCGFAKINHHAHWFFILKTHICILSSFSCPSFNPLFWFW